MRTPKPPKAPDPNQLIQAQERLNRVNTSTPFGSQQYSTGPDGRATLTTQYSPQMQALAERSMRLAGTDANRYQMPQGMEQIMGGMMNRIGSRYGQGDGVGQSVAQSGGRKPMQPQQMPQPQVQQMQQGGGGLVKPGMDLAQVDPVQQMRGGGSMMHRAGGGVSPQGGMQSSQLAQMLMMMRGK